MKHLLTALLLTVFLTTAHAQQRWFVDGMHGGVYGHYPMKTYTQFLNDQLEKHPDWRLGLEIEPETWDTVLVQTPEEYKRFQQHMAGKQLEYTNPSYAQSYLYCIQGESIIRQFQMGMQLLQKHFPGLRMQTYAVEEPCFTSCLPTLLPQLGFRYVVLKCPDTCWGGYAAPFGGQFVSLQGPAGDQMLCVPRYACEDLQPKTTWQTIAWSNQPQYWKACENAGISNPVGMCYQDAGWTGGPWIGSGDKIRFGTKYTLWSDYFQRYETTADAPVHPFSQEEVCPGLMWGSQVLQRLAQQVRQSENLLLQAEHITTLQDLLGSETTPSADMHEAWRQLLLSQHHDCWIVPYNHLNNRGNWAQNVILWTQSSDSIAQSALGTKGKAFVNTLARPRNEVVETPQGIYQVQAPAFGYTTRYTSARKKSSVRTHANSCQMENDLYRLCMDLKHGGVLTSLYSKEAKVEYTNQTDSLQMGEIRGFFRKRGGFRSSIEYPARAEILVDNSLMKRVQLKGMVAGVPFTQIITLKEGDPLIDIDLQLHWQGGEEVGDTCFYDSRYMLSYLLPSALGETRLVKSAPFDVCTSTQDHSYYRSWDAIRHNLILDWLDVESVSGSHSLALLSDHTTSYTWGKNEALALTLQYSGRGLWGRNYSLTHPTHIHFALLPHTGSWQEVDVPYHNQRWSQPLLSLEQPASTDEKSLLDLSGTGYQLSYSSMEDGTLTLRFYNVTGTDAPQKIQLPFVANRIQHVNLLGEVQKEIPVCKQANGSQFTISIPGQGVSTYRITSDKY